MSEPVKNNQPKNFYDATYHAIEDPGQRSRQAHQRKVRWEQAFYRSLIYPTADQSVLDVGCGEGRFLASIQNTGANLWGIDISQIATDVAKQAVAQPEQILCEDALPLPFPDDHFDYVTAWGSSEHFPNPIDIMREMRRVVKSTGTVIIMLPNAYYYKFVWDTLRKGTGPVKHQQPEVLYAFGEWKSIIESTGLSVVRATSHNKFNKPWFGILRKLLIPFYLSNHFVFLCRK